MDQRWAWPGAPWATLGLPLAGIGTLMFAPIALFRSLDVLINQPLDRADWARAVIDMILSLLLWERGWPWACYCYCIFCRKIRLGAGHRPATHAPQ